MMDLRTSIAQMDQTLDHLRLLQTSAGSDSPMYRAAQSARDAIAEVRERLIIRLYETQLAQP